MLKTVIGKCVHVSLTYIKSFIFCCFICKLISSDRGGSRIMEKGGSDKYIHNWGGYGRGRAPSRDSKRVWGSADSSPSGVWGFAPAAFLLLRLFSMKFTVISNTFPSRDIRITRACMDSDEKTLHSSQCYGSYWLSN